MHQDRDPPFEPRRWLRELSEIVDAVPDLVATFDRDGRLLLMNAAGIDVLGHPPPELEKLLISDLYPADDAERVVDGALKDALTRGIWSGYAALVSADGAHIETHQRWVAHRLDDERAGAFTLVARVTTDSLAETELRNRRESAAAMTLGVVHDLNNVFGPILAYADLASEAVGSDHGAARFVAQIIAASKRGAALTARLADSARGREAERAAVDIAPIADEVARWIRLARPDLDITVTGDIEKGARVWGDAVQLHQVVHNLARNAAEALSDRGGSIRIAIDVARAPGKRGRHARVEVRDDGRGIDERERSRIFEPFYSSGKGTGLGLTVSREIVRAHDGVLSIERAEPRGTRATVYLPLWQKDSTEP